MGIIINHYTDPYRSTSIMESKSFLLGLMSRSQHDLGFSWFLMFLWEFLQQAFLHSSESWYPSLTNFNHQQTNLKTSIQSKQKKHISTQKKLIHLSVTTESLPMARRFTRLYLGVSFQSPATKILLGIRGDFLEVMDSCALMEFFSLSSPFRAWRRNAWYNQKLKMKWY